MVAKNRQKSENIQSSEDYSKYGTKGKNNNWPGCTTKFVKKTLKRRKKNKMAKESRRRNRN